MALVTSTGFTWAGFETGNNAGYGSNAGYVIFHSGTGTENSFFGYQTSTGEENNFVGYSAGYTPTQLVCVISFLDGTPAIAMLAEVIIA